MCKHIQHNFPNLNGKDYIILGSKITKRKKGLSSYHDVHVIPNFVQKDSRKS